MPVASGTAHKEIEEFRAALLRLADRRSEIENEIEMHTAVLTRNGVGMDDRLTDENDYPRNDIDVYQVRHARHRIICLQNDHKTVTKQIEEGLHELHSLAGGPREPPSPPAEAPFRPPPRPRIREDAETNGHDQAAAEALQNHNGVHVQRPEVIAKVNFVSEGSPADTAGIKVDDEIVEFGSVNASNIKEIGQIGEVVQSSVNRPIVVKILRAPSDGVVELSLTPRTWSGRGLLGCSIVPAT